ncbi:quinone oxidoreductase family protein [Sphingobium sp. CCH11-B1]|jgi:NADPH2:quinone reductase|uniref:quinone oxidoreductase family protein n=1 Tax=Sphingobium sp. CCH11-B1 TaxID=1768781 RepID=UPI0008299082|nr:quinone oxidoreductase [Sphingobium sp. CCH11-B1]MEA3389210.1 quinone oxidoreductase [Pseudomonadota bacterium]
MVIRVNGGPDVMEREYFDPGAPDQGEVLIENKAVGLNYIDTYFRSGLYPADLPLTLGSEAAGEIVAVGPGVSGFSVGDRVACATARGSYCTHWRVPATQVVHLPDDISFEDAAAMMLKGMTACFLAEDVWPLKAGQTALVHAAAGGVGSILVPWLRDKGVVVIAHSGSAAKAASVAADFSLHAPMDDLAAQVRERTNGEGVDIVYDGIGKAGWSASLASVKPRGLLVSYGNASGPVPPVNLLDLSRGGSLYVTRPTLFNYVATPEELAHTARRLFDRMEKGVVGAVIGQRYALADAAQAHRALESRQTVGSTLLIP